jgi:hypothetical protein
VGIGAAVGDGWWVSRFPGSETPRPAPLPRSLSVFPWIAGRWRRGPWVTGARHVRRLDPSDAGRSPCVQVGAAASPAPPPSDAGATGDSKPQDTATTGQTTAAQDTGNHRTNHSTGRHPYLSKLLRLLRIDTSKFGKNHKVLTYLPLKTITPPPLTDCHPLYH